MIRIDNLRFSYGDKGFELNIPALTIDSGEQIAIVGRSGTGKTTLLHLIAGVATAKQGDIRVNQTLVNQLSDAQRRAFRIAHIGFVFQEFELMDHLTVYDNIRLPYLISRTLRWNVQSDHHLQGLAASCGLGRLLSRYPRQLSHGERQRVAVCRALITKPALILADEPTGSLDQRTGNEVLELLLQQASELGSTLLTVTHDPSIAQRMHRTMDISAFHQYASTAGER